MRLRFDAVPIQASLGVLGRRWALRVLMTIALGQAQRFNGILRATPGMSKRILAMRLRDLERDGYLSRAEHDQRYASWELTQKGADVLPVLLTLVQFRSKWQSPSEAPSPPPPSWGNSFEVSFLPKRDRGPSR